MPVFDTPEALQAHRVVSQRAHDLQVVQDAAGRVETLLTAADIRHLETALQAPAVVNERLRELLQQKPVWASAPLASS